MSFLFFFWVSKYLNSHTRTHIHTHTLVKSHHNTPIYLLLSILLLFFILLLFYKQKAPCIATRGIEYKLWLFTLRSFGYLHGHCLGISHTSP